MTEPKYPSPLAAWAAQNQDLDPESLWEFMGHIWRDHGILIIVLPEVEKRAGWVNARNARNLAETLFGKRGK